MTIDAASIDAAYVVLQSTRQSGLRRRSYSKGLSMSWGRSRDWGSSWAPYVSIGEKLNMAVRLADQLAKKQNREVSPVKLQGSKIAKTFWGKAWCDNLTAYQDFSNRLPRGATYVRNGSVVDLVIDPKKINAIVAGSQPYTVKIEITALDAGRWKALRSECSKSIDSLLDLLSGKLSDGVMKQLTDQKTGLFPSPKEIKMSCSCPDYSSCCKHLAAVMYGVGSRLDSRPELLFLLRGVNHQELVSEAIAAGNLNRELSAVDDGGLATQDLSELFGIELDSSQLAASGPGKEKSRTVKTSPKKTSSRKIVEPIVSTGTSKKQKSEMKKAGVKKADVKKAAPAKRVIKPVVPSNGKQTEPSKRGRRELGSEKTTVRKAPVAKVAIARTKKKEQTSKKAAAPPKTVARTTAKQKAAARQVKRPTGAD